MASKRIGFIGYGNMAQAMATGWVNGGIVNPSDVFVMDVDRNKTEYARDTLGFFCSYTVEQITLMVDILVIAVKPNEYIGVINEIKAKLPKKTIVVSIAAGLTIETLERHFDKPVKLVRTMPNMPVRVGAGMTALMPNQLMTPADMELIEKLFSSFGQVGVISEELIDAAIVTSGSAPAYVYLMIEAMIQGGMAEGMSRDVATRFASQAVLGAAKMVLETGIEPENLCDAVCSPNGTTIEAVNYLREHDFSNTVQKAMHACAERSREMAKK